MIITITTIEIIIASVFFALVLCLFWWAYNIPKKTHKNTKGETETCFLSKRKEKIIKTAISLGILPTEEPVYLYDIPRLNYRGYELTIYNFKEHENNGLIYIQVISGARYEEICLTEELFFGDFNMAVISRIDEAIKRLELNRENGNEIGKFNKRSQYGGYYPHLTDKQLYDAVVRPYLAYNACLDRHKELNEISRSATKEELAELMKESNLLYEYIKYIDGKKHGGA